MVAAVVVGSKRGSGVQEAAAAAAEGSEVVPRAERGKARRSSSVAVDEGSTADDDAPLEAQKNLEGASAGSVRFREAMSAREKSERGVLWFMWRRAFTQLALGFGRVSRREESSDLFFA